MKSFFVFVVVCSIVHLSFDVVTSEQRLPNDNRKEHFGTRTAPRGHGHTFKNFDFNRRREPPLEPNCPRVNDTNGNLTNVHPDSGIRHPLVPRPPVNETIGRLPNLISDSRGPKAPTVLNSPRVNDTDRINENFSLSDFADKLDEQYDETSRSIVQAWLKCNESWSLPPGISLKFFVNPPWDQDVVSVGAKGLADCTIRKVGVMTNSGFQEAVYLEQVKKLMFNYTSFDINRKSSETKRNILRTIRILSKNHYDIRGKCFPVGTRIDTLKTVSLADICYELIQSYEQAARKCKNLRHSSGEGFETSWMIIDCIMKKNRENRFAGAFYPGLYSEAWLFGTQRIALPSTSTLASLLTTSTLASLPTTE